jgi:uncharacterized protein YgfB (UPF0149 family)
MKTLAKAMIGAAAFLELSSDGTVNPDDAVRALEDISATLQSASPDEVAAIRVALQELIAEERTSFARTDALRFYEHFLESVGLADDGVT